VSQPVSIAEWIEALRADLEDAALRQKQRLSAEREPGREMAVPGLRLHELKLELEVRTTRETSGSAGLKFWVVSGEADRKIAEGATQRVTLVLQPERDVHLGDDPGFLDD
jgi:hypothetical protein